MQHTKRLALDGLPLSAPKKTVMMTYTATTTDSALTKKEIEREVFHWATKVASSRWYNRSYPLRELRYWISRQAMQHTKTVEDWEDRFESFKRTVVKDGETWGLNNAAWETLKEFFSTTIHTVVRAREAELREAIEMMKRMESDYDDEDKRARRDVRPYNEALNDLLALLTPPTQP